MIEVLLLLLLAGYYAWRYSKTDADPDWAMFNLWAFCGSAYGRDFVDCKTPAIHLFFLGIRKVVGYNIERVRFAYHFIISGLAILSLVFSWNPWAVFAFIVLVNSGWLFSFHGNVGGLSAACVFLALCAPPGWAVAFLGLAVFVEPKLIFSAALVIALKGWWIEGVALAAFAGAVCAVIYLGWPQVWAWLVEMNITIPKRMQAARKGLYPWNPEYTAKGWMYIFPWLLLAVLALPDVGYWLPVCAFLLLLGMGYVIRPNHLLPLAAWIATAGLSPMLIIVLTLADWLSAAGYIKGTWATFYPGIAKRNYIAKQVGLWLKDKPGTLWANTLDCGVYLYSGKPVQFGMNEQIELRDSALERRELWRAGWKANPPDWVVNEPEYGTIKFNSIGYKQVAQLEHLNIYEKVRR
jgi:hypothetical protein